MLISRKKKIMIVGILLFALLFEIYAQTYVSEHALTVVSKDQARSSMYPGHYMGDYSFNQSNCIWFAEWKIEKPYSHNPWGFVYIFKVGENSSFLSSPTTIMVSSLQMDTLENVTCFFNTGKDVFYNDNSTQLRIIFDFAENGSYPLSLRLNLKFYQRTLVGLVPTGETTIPINVTVEAEIRS